MWKDFSRSYLARNRAAGWTVAAAALAAAFFLSLLCSLAYNLWVYEIRRITQEEGGWHARVTVAQDGGQPDETLQKLTQFANVETAVLSPAPAAEGSAVIELTFRDRGSIYRDLALIRDALALPADAVQAHSTLLALYLVTDPQDPSPPLLLPFLLAVLGAAAAALVLLIRSSFEITMQARLHQFGILASIGATPRQIRACLLQEAAGLTVLFSAWLPARRLSRMTPLQALRDGPAPAARGRRRRPARLLALLFGIRGELAGGALKAQAKSLRIANVSLLLSFLGFTAMLCFFTLSGISTQMTYFARYQDAWDVMAVLPDVPLSEFALTQQLQDLPGVESCAAYSRADAACLLPADAQSDELQALGGLSALAGSDAVPQGSGWLVDAPVVVLDDASFLAYCRQAGVEPSLEGAVLLNRVWDSLHSNFRDRAYLPFVQPDLAALPLAGPDGSPLGELPLLGCTDTPPALREEYDQYTLVQFWPLSLWQSLGGRLGLADAGGTTLRILGGEGITLAGCEALEAQIRPLLEQADYAFTIENRIGEQLANDRMIAGAQGILGGFCLLLAAIGLANVFLNTLGYAGQRRREFARYLAVGMTPGELRSLFWIEAAVLAGRPLAVTLPLTALMVAFMLRASYLDAGVFLARAPVLPVALFAALIVAAVALAYALGARRVLTGDLTGLLKDDSLR